MHQPASLLPRHHRLQPLSRYRNALHAFTHGLGPETPHTTENRTVGNLPPGRNVRQPCPQKQSRLTDHRVCVAGAMRIVTIGILQEEDLTCTTPTHPISHQRLIKSRHRSPTIPLVTDRARPRHPMRLSRHPPPPLHQSQPPPLQPQQEPIVIGRHHIHRHDSRTLSAAPVACRAGFAFRARHQSRSADRAHGSGEHGSECSVHADLQQDEARLDSLVRNQSEGSGFGSIDHGDGGALVLIYLSIHLSRRKPTHPSIHPSIHPPPAKHKPISPPVSVSLSPSRRGEKNNRKPNRTKRKRRMKQFSNPTLKIAAVGCSVALLQYYNVEFGCGSLGWIR